MARDLAGAAALAAGYSAAAVAAMAERRIVLDLNIYGPAMDGVEEDQVLMGKAALD